MAFFGKERDARKPPRPPDALLSGVGFGDYYGIGERALALLEELSDLRATDRILDIGCGLGRLAWPLSEKLTRRGSYDGFDAAKPYIDWCTENLGLDPAQFRFHHADIRTSLYNPNGALAAESFQFPWANGSFDLAIATSLFTHLLPAAAEHYLAEIARTLEPGGRLFATFFLLDQRGREASAAGATNPTFGTAIEHGLVHDPVVPESAVAFDAEWLFATLAAAGMRVASVHPGYWKGKPGFEYQDIVVSVRER